MNYYVPEKERGEDTPAEKERHSLYLRLWQAEQRDPLKFLPSNTFRTFPRSGNEWLYGFTYRGTGIINVRDDLQGETLLETQIHESLHTSDEYETRRLTEWIMRLIPLEPEKYRTRPKEYIQ